MITFHSLNIIQTFQIQKVSDDIYFWIYYHNHQKIQMKLIKHVKFRDSSMLKMQADTSYCFNSVADLFSGKTVNFILKPS